MNEGTVTELLARTLGEAWITAGPRAWEEQSEARRAGARHLADALLPVVREIAAEELRAAADEAHDEYSGWEAANVVRARADALTGRTS